MSRAHMTVTDLMTTALITLKPRDIIGNAEIEMKFAAIRHIPIVDDRGKLVGMVSNRDILRALGQSRNHAVAVKDIMTTNLYTVQQNALARDAAALILEHKVGAIPVLGDEGQLVGLVTETDFVRLAYQQLGGVATW